MTICPNCGKEDFIDQGEDWCYQCKKRNKKMICLNCTKTFLACGHLIIEKGQCSVTKSR